MLFEEHDIDFTQLSGAQFEELCFDLLWRMGFHHLVWRQGGSDSGRDIEAKYTTSNPLLGSFAEQWFIECKNHKHELGVEDLASKLAWAEAERPQHLVIITSSYVTNRTREWIDKTAQRAPFRVHLLEGKALKQLLLGIPELVEKYFIDKYRKLLRSAMKDWLIHDVIPGPETQLLLWKELVPAKLSSSEAVFLCCTYLADSRQIESYTDEDVYMSFDELVARMDLPTASTTSIITSSNVDRVRLTLTGSDAWFVEPYRFTFALLEYNDGTAVTDGLYGYVVHEDQGIEMLLLGRQDFQAVVRSVETGADQE